MKRLICLLIALICSFSLAACEITNTPTTEPDVTEEVFSEDRLLTEQDRDDIIVMIQDAPYTVEGFNGLVCNISIVNSTSMELRFELQNVKINNQLVEYDFSATLQPNEQDISLLRFAQEDLNAFGIENIETIQCGVRVYDATDIDNVVIDIPVGQEFSFSAAG